MAKLDLSKYGITGTTEIVYNPSYEQLFEEETKPELEGYEKGQVSELGAVNVMTGIYTGRSPKDKFIVMDENSKDTVWWTSDEYKNDNHPASQEAWEAVKEIAKKELSNKRLYVAHPVLAQPPLLQRLRQRRGRRCGRKAGDEAGPQPEGRCAGLRGGPVRPVRGLRPKAGRSLRLNRKIRTSYLPCGAKQGILKGAF